jgi:DNA polymerase-3 subunit gamma/tau
VTEFSDDTALAQDAAAPAQQAAPAAARAAAAPGHAYVITPVPEIDWDGNWPGLAATLALRGVAQQLALQTELIECSSDGHQSTFRLRAPIDTLRASGNAEKLTAAIQDRFPNTRVAGEVELGPVWPSAELLAYRGGACVGRAGRRRRPFVRNGAPAGRSSPGSVRPPRRRPGIESVPFCCHPFRFREHHHDEEPARRLDEAGQTMQDNMKKAQELALVEVEGQSAPAW